MLLTTLSGCFREFDGMLAVGVGAPQATGTVAAASIDTGEPVRDEHLRSSPDFFDVERHPQISFKSTRISDSDGELLQIAGELTMRGVTRAVELSARPAGRSRDADGRERLELQLHGELNRRDFGLVWNQALDTGGALLGNKVKLALEISAVKTPPPAA
jgi:polyisoprenoid-binding protein YceI